MLRMDESSLFVCSECGRQLHSEFGLLHHLAHWHPDHPGRTNSRHTSAGVYSHYQPQYQRRGADTAGRPRLQEKSRSFQEEEYHQQQEYLEDPYGSEYQPVYASRSDVLYSTPKTALSHPNLAGYQVMTGPNYHYPTQHQPPSSAYSDMNAPFSASTAAILYPHLGPNSSSNLAAMNYRNSPSQQVIEENPVWRRTMSPRQYFQEPRSVKSPAPRVADSQGFHGATSRPRAKYSTSSEVSRPHSSRQSPVTSTYASQNLVVWSVSPASTNADEEHFKFQQQAMLSRSPQNGVHQAKSSSVPSSVAQKRSPSSSVGVVEESEIVPMTAARQNFALVPVAAAFRRKKQHPQTPATGQQSSSSTPQMKRQPEGLPRTDRLPSWDSDSHSRASNPSSSRLLSVPRSPAFSTSPDSSHQSLSKQKHSISSPFSLSGQHNSLEDVLSLVFTYLDTRSLALAGGVSRMWRRVSRQPPLWCHIRIAQARLPGRTLSLMSAWCTQVVSITFNNLKRNHSYQNKFPLETAMEAFLKLNQSTLRSLKIIDCKEELGTHTILFASVNCSSLERLVYLSDREPLGVEALWALGKGCKRLHTLVVTPLFPNKQPYKFNDQCCYTIAQNWPMLQVLCVGGRNLTSEGLIVIAASCSRLRHLELDHSCEITEAIAVSLVKAGLRGLEKLDFSFTPVTPRAIMQFNSACPKLSHIGVHAGISDYYPREITEKSQIEFATLTSIFHKLAQRPPFNRILDIKLDY